MPPRLFSNFGQEQTVPKTHVFNRCFHVKTLLFLNILVSLIRHAQLYFTTDHYCDPVRNNVFSVCILKIFLIFQSIKWNDNCFTAYFSLVRKLWFIKRMTIVLQGLVRKLWFNKMKLYDTCCRLLDTSTVNVSLYFYLITSHPSGFNGLIWGEAFAIVL